MGAGSLDTLFFKYPVVSDTTVRCSVQFQLSILLSGCTFQSAYKIG